MNTGNSFISVSRKLLPARFDRGVTVSRYLIGVDVGGTTAKIALFDSEKISEILVKTAVPTRTESDGVHILPDIAHLHCSVAFIQTQMRVSNRDRFAEYLPGCNHHRAGLVLVNHLR